MNLIMSALARTRTSFTFTAIKHGYRCFNLDSNATVPLQCIALVFWIAYVDRMSSG